MYPWKSLATFFNRLVSEFHHYFSRGLSSSKRFPTIFKMVVDFQGYMIFGEFFSLLSTPDVNECWCSIFEFWSSQNGTLPETNSSPLKMDGWNTSLSYSGGLFSGAFAVSFREGNTTKNMDTLTHHVFPKNSLDFQKW